MSLVLESSGNLSARSWNLLGNDADAKICTSAHLRSVFEQFLCYFLHLVTVMNIYSSMDSAIVLYICVTG